MIFLLTLVFVFCVLASYFDLKKRIVPDWLNAFFFFLALALVLFQQSQSALFVSSGLQAWFKQVGLTSLAFPQVDLTAFALLVGGSFVFAYALYKLGAWAGGDAKFFTALMAFVPLLKEIDFTLPLKVFLLSVLLLVPFLLVEHAKQIAGEKRLLRFLAARAFYSACASVIATVSFGVVFNFIDYGRLLLVFVLSFLAVFAFFAFHALSEKLLRTRVAVEKLQEGMVPAESVVLERGKLVSRELSLLQAAKRMALGRALFDGKVLANAFLARGLSKEEIVELKKARGLRFLQVRETIAFAPLVATAFFAVVFT